MQVRKAQIGTGDREVYVNEEGERMSRLREVDSDWIIRRLERWGKRVRRMEPPLPHFLLCLIKLIPREAALLGALTHKGGSSTRSAQHVKSSKGLCDRSSLNELSEQSCAGQDAVHWA